MDWFCRRQTLVRYLKGFSGQSGGGWRLEERLEGKPIWQKQPGGGVPHYFPGSCTRGKGVSGHLWRPGFSQLANSAERKLRQLRQFHLSIFSSVLAVLSSGVHIQLMWCFGNPAIWSAFPDMILWVGISAPPVREEGTVGWSEKHKSWKMQKYRADSEPRHSTDFRTIFVIMIGRFVSCEIGQT